MANRQTGNMLLFLRIYGGPCASRSEDSTLCRLDRTGMLHRTIPSLSDAQSMVGLLALPSVIQALELGAGYRIQDGVYAERVVNSILEKMGLGGPS